MSKLLPISSFPWFVSLIYITLEGWSISESALQFISCLSRFLGYCIETIDKFEENLFLNNIIWQFIMMIYVYLFKPLFSQQHLDIFSVQVLCIFVKFIPLCIYMCIIVCVCIYVCVYIYIHTQSVFNVTVFLVYCEWYF